MAHQDKRKFLSNKQWRTTNTKASQKCFTSTEWKGGWKDVMGYTTRVGKWRRFAAKEKQQLVEHSFSSFSFLFSVVFVTWLGSLVFLVREITDVNLWFCWKFFSSIPQSGNDLNFSAFFCWLKINSMIWKMISKSDVKNHKMAFIRSYTSIIRITTWKFI